MKSKNSSRCATLVLYNLGKQIFHEVKEAKENTVFVIIYDLIV